MESISQAKILRNTLWDANRVFEREHELAKYWRLFARHWTEENKKENIDKVLDQLNKETDAFLKMQDASIEFYNYLLITEGGYDR